MFYHCDCQPLQVEVEYAKNAFDNILRNKTLEDLYAANGKALGMEFTTDEEVLRNASGESAELGKKKRGNILCCVALTQLLLSAPRRLHRLWQRDVCSSWYPSVFLHWL